MRQFLLNVLSGLVALSIAAGLAYGLHRATRPMTSFTIDASEWSCSTAGDGRMLSCTKHRSP